MTPCLLMYQCAAQCHGYCKVDCYLPGHTWMVAGLLIVQGIVAVKIQLQYCSILLTAALITYMLSAGSHSAILAWLDANALRCYAA